MSRFSLLDFCHRIGTLEVSQVLGSFLCFPVDPAVEYGHDGDRDIESGNGGPKSDGGLREELDLALIRWYCPLPDQVLPAEDGWRPEDEGDQPCQADHDASPLWGTLGSVCQWSCDGKVTIKANHQKVHDRSVAGYIVECKPKVTGQTPENPASHEDVGRVEVHGEDANDEVCTGQAEQVIVVNCLELTVDFEGDHDQDIADNGHQTDHSGHSCNSNDFPQSMAFQSLVIYWGAVDSGFIVIRLPFHPGSRNYTQIWSKVWRYSLFGATSPLLGQYLEETQTGQFRSSHTLLHSFLFHLGFIIANKIMKCT